MAPAGILFAEVSIVQFVVVVSIVNCVGKTIVNVVSDPAVEVCIQTLPEGAEVAECLSGL